MSGNQRSNRMRRAKSEITHDRISMSHLRTEFRSSFFNRLRISRSRSVDRFRQIVEDYGDNIQYKSVHDLRKALLKDQEATKLMKTDEVNNILAQIEKEMALVRLQSEADGYLDGVHGETEDIVNRHLVCSICNNISDGNSMCAGCSTAFRSEFN